GPADHRPRIDPDLRRQFQRLRPHLFGQGRARRAELRLRHPRHLLLPHLLRKPVAGGQSDDGRGGGDGDVLHRSGRRLPLSLHRPAPHAALLVLGGPMLKQRGETLGVHIILVAYSLLAIGPILLVVMNSFKTRKAIFVAPLDTTTFSLIGYYKVFNASHIVTYFANSLIVTLVSMALVLLFGAMAAWALTEYKFRGSTALALFLSIGIMVPIRLGSVAIVTMMRKAGLNDTLTALILVYVAQGLPLSIFILAEFVQQIPKDLRDA